MSARCETIGRYVLPVFRSLIAAELVRTYNFTQVKAAKRLGTTQAAISQYLNSKRASKSLRKCGNLLPRIRTVAKETAKRLANEEIEYSEIAVDVCKLCKVLNNEETLKQTADDYAI